MAQLTDIIYAEEELKQTIHALLAEKERGKELEQQLLQHAIDKNMYGEQQQQTQIAEEENAALKEQQLALIQHAEQLQELHDQTQNQLTDTLKELQDSHRMQNDVEQENESLKQQMQELQNLFSLRAETDVQAEESKRALQEVQEQNRRYQQRIEKLVQTIQEREKRLQELQKFEYSCKKANEKKLELELTLESEYDKLHALTDKEAQLNQVIIESQQHTKQLERVIQFLRERSEESQLEAKQLKEEFQLAQDALLRLSKECESAKLESIECKQHLSLEQNEKQEAIDEVKAIQEQFEFLKNDVLTTSQELELSHSALSEAQALTNKLQTEIQRLQNAMQEKNAHFLALEKEIGATKQMIVRGVREAQELEARYLETINEKVAAMTKSHQAQQQVERQREELRLLREQLKATLTQSSTEQGQMIEQLRNELRTLSRGKQELEQQLLENQNARENSDLQMKIAQQHLAKKVKEAALSIEKNIEQTIQLEELRYQFIAAQTRISEIQNGLELQQQHEKQLREQLDETIKIGEVQVSKWEEKYFRMYDKWQEMEAQNKQLKIMEEKHNQMQTMLANLGTIMGSPSNAAAPMSGMLSSLAIKPSLHIVDTQKITSGILYADTKPSPMQAMAEEEKIESPQPVVEISSPHQNLFDRPEPSMRYKQSLFE